MERHVTEHFAARERLRRDAPQIELLAGLRHLAVVHLRVDADVVERAGDDRQHDAAALRTAGVLALEVVALPRGESTDGEPDDEQQRSDAHHDLHGTGVPCLCPAPADDETRQRRWKTTCQSLPPRSTA